MGMHAGCQSFEQPGAFAGMLDDQIDGLEPVDVPQCELLVRNKDVSKLLHQMGNHADFVSYGAAKVRSLIIENIHSSP